MTDQNHPDAVPDHSQVVPTDMPPPRDAPAASWWRTQCQRAARSYWGRVLLLAVFCHLLGALLWIVTGQPPTIPTSVNFIACAVLIACRYVQDVRNARTVLALFSFGVMLPAAITTGSPDYWVGFGWPLFCACVGAAICARARRNETRHRTIWLNEPNGRDVLLDSQPFRCPRCDRVHHALFAVGEPLRIAQFPPRLHVETPGRKRRRPTPRNNNRSRGAKRVHVLARFFVDDDGQMWLAPRPAEFVPDPERCFAFAVTPGPHEP